MLSGNNLMRMWLEQNRRKPPFLCLTALQPGSRFRIRTVGSGTPSVSFAVSEDGDNWTDYSLNDYITLGLGEKCYIKGDNATLGAAYSSYTQFQMTGMLAASGNIMSLLDSTCRSRSFSSAYAVKGLFNGCISLVTAPELPATGLTDNCYDNTLRNTGITEAPELPATTLAPYCYSYMLGNTPIRKMPRLPATYVPNYAYQYMLYQCESLDDATAGISATNVGTRGMLHMFDGCTSLATAPQLSVTEFTTGACLMEMFSGCASLSRIQVSNTSWGRATDTTFNDWVSGVAASGTFVCPSALPEEYGVNRIPTGWTRVTY